MATLTRADVIYRAKLKTNETIAKAGWLEPDGWSFCVDDACDELGRLDAQWLVRGANIVSGVSSYCYPDMRRITSIVITQSTGNIITVEPITPWIMDQRVPGWRNQPNQGDVVYAIVESPGTIILYPQPNYTSTFNSTTLTGGFMLEGFDVPSSAGSNSASLWPDLTDPCPLPARVHPFLIYGTAMYRCMQFAGDPNYDPSYQQIVPVWERMKGELEMEIEEANDASRFADAPDSSDLWLTGGGWGAW